MRSVLILFATSHGQTQRIGERLATNLRIAGHDRHATETWRDHEYTDWAAVDKLAREIADELAPPAQAAALWLPTDEPTQAELPELRVVGQETGLRRY